MPSPEPPDLLSLPHDLLGPAPEPGWRPVQGASLGVDVTAVLVAHDGAGWLPEVLAALAASACVPAEVVCVDTGSTDGSAELLEGAYGQVLRLPRHTGYGAAVAAGLAGRPKTDWVWLLHDDCAVEPDTLQQLLEHAAASPSVGILGPKVRDWHDPRLLVEVGLTTDTAGHRETGLDRHEYDQGQHDAIRDVLAVGTAGALVRRPLWDRLGGLEPCLPVFRDDLDLGWRANSAGARVVVVPAARVRHVRAATTGRRTTDAAPGRATGIDRRHALFVLLAHASWLRLAGRVPRLLLATVLRVAGLLLTRQLAAAVDEVRAVLGVLGHPVRMLSARRARARTRTVPQRELRHLFASRSVRLRARAAAVADRFGGGAAPASSPLGALGDPGPEGPGELDDLALGGGGTLRRLLLRPATVLLLALTLIALVAERRVLSVQGGRLAGGLLLPAPAGARDLWTSYVGTWHAVSVGSGRLAPPATGALAAVSTVLLGKPWLAVDVLLLASVPLAGLTAYLAAGRLVRHLVPRLWGAATWALLPVATGAIAAGRLDAAAVQVGLPLLLLGAGRLLSGDVRATGWSRAWATGLGLGVLSAFAPVLWPLGAVALLGCALARAGSPGGGGRLLAGVIVALVPLALLVPWSLAAVVHPSVLLGTAGQGPLDRGLAGWQLLLLSPGGPGVPAAGVTVGLVLAAVGGTVRRARRAVAVTAWGVALLCLGVAVALTRVSLRPPGGGAATPAWPGLALQLAAAAMLIAALVAADGLRRRLATNDFGGRQLLAGLLVLAAATVPVLDAAGWLLRGADGPLRRDLHAVLPAFAQAELDARPGQRVLVLSRAGNDTLGYELTGAAGTQLPDAGTPPSSGQSAALDAVVADLATPRGSDAAQALSTRAVRYVALLTSPTTGSLSLALDAQAGLVRRTGGAVALWQVVGPAHRLSLLPPPLAAAARSGASGPGLALLRSSPPVALPSNREAASAVLPAGGRGRLVVLAEAQDAGWRATLDGVPLARRTAWGWAQGFVLPSSGGNLVLRHEQAHRCRWLLVQGGLVVLVLVLAVPGRRSRAGLLDRADTQDDLA